MDAWEPSDRRPWYQASRAGAVGPRGEEAWFEPHSPLGRRAWGAVGVSALLPRPASPAPGVVGAALSENLRRLRRERGLTLDALALRSGVSRAMLSKVERRTAVPTATVLGKLAAGLGVGLSQLVGVQQPRGPSLVRVEEQAVYRDPVSGLERRSLSPLFADRSVDLAFNTLPAGAHVVFPAHQTGVEEYLFVSRGALVVVVDGERHRVGRGSTLFYPAHVTHEFHNEATEAAEFYIVVDSTRTR
ncbi:MAG: helix-turn-helix transcriptional regulator [Parafilimonas terrae]|nr:helix-turn-helix transcriptional regulator [Parafilimonas terrae]